MADWWRRARFAIPALVWVCAGCFGGNKLNCEDPEFYAYSTSAPPVRVPDGLDVPDESNALQIPPGQEFVLRQIDSLTECLETPPDFFADEPEETAAERVIQ